MDNPQIAASRGGSRPHQLCEEEGYNKCEICDCT